MTVANFGMETQAATATNSVTTSSEQCPICQRRFPYVSQLIAHVNREHPDPSSSSSWPAPSASSAAARPSTTPAAAAAAGSETCPQCRAVFPDLTALIRHAETAHAGVTTSSDQDKCQLM